ncbi:MAG TPA: glutathione S-transferase N-terminal domain-containing protein [Polyangiaceae bacterium]|jgi:glutathione S-transferase|nr:glutathione S-transferase N-terminal domain-containing protein [Polyangiaceae bacterium]
MKLLTSPTSPFGRKVRIALLEKHLAHEVANPWSAQAGLVLDRHNPLGKVPALILDDDTTLFDSVVIVEYVDTLADAPRLIPTEPRERALVRRWEALADGMMESTVSIMLEGRRPEAQRSAEAIAKQLGKVRTSLAFAERELGERSFAHGAAFGLADAALVSALGYLDLRLASEPWREQHPGLARYAAALATRPSVAETVPPS